MENDIQNWKVPKDKTPTLSGWRYGVFIGGLATLLGTAIYFAIIEPKMNPEKYRKIQRQTRKGEDLQARQPGGIMKVWTDPFKKDS